MPDGKQPGSFDDLTRTLYQELRKVAAARMSNEPPNQTLQATALVNEAWIRLGGDQSPAWASRAQFFSAAAEAMRRILIDRARRRMAIRHGGGRHRVDMDAGPHGLENQISVATEDRQLVALHEALASLEECDPETANLVKLRYFVGMTLNEIAEAADLSKRTTERRLAFAYAWLGKCMNPSP